MTTDTLSSDSNPNLGRGGKLVSYNGRAVFEAQDDGNLCVYATEKVGLPGRELLWKSDTDGKYFDRLCMNANGELAAFLPNSSDTTWKSGSWNSGRAGPYRLVMQDDGNLVVYSHDNTPIWATDSHVSPEPIEFREVQFENAGSAVVCLPSVRSASGRNVVWPGDAYWALTPGMSKKIDFSRDTTNAPGGNQVPIGAFVGGLGTVVTLGFNVVGGDDVWVDPFRKYQFRCNPESKIRVVVQKDGGARSGNAYYLGAVPI